MNTEVIQFDVDKARAILDQAKTEAEALKPIEHLVPLIESINKAQQALGSMRLINGGYAGQNLRAEIAQAESLPDHLAAAGRICQRLIMEMQ